MRQRYRRNGRSARAIPRWTAFTLLRASLLISSSNARSLVTPEQLSATPTYLSLDLSYLHRTKPSLLAQAIENALEQHDAVDIDLTASLIDKDTDAIFLELLGAREYQSKCVRFGARRNHWTPESADKLLQWILGDDKPNKYTGTSTGTWKLDQLDLSCNDFRPESRGYKTFLKSLQNMVGDPVKCPAVLRLDVCGLGPDACRAIGKGIMTRFQVDANQVTVATSTILPLSLHLTRNEDIGDTGIAAIAAAIRTVVSHHDRQDEDTSTESSDETVLDILDLSACGIGDTGAEALAIALGDHPLCVRRLDLSSNQISDEGAVSLGRALLRGKVETLDLSNNKDISDEGAKALARALEQGAVTNLVIRSCHIHADGAACFATALKSIGKRKEMKFLSLDLSGNPLGILRKKAKTGGSKYSATALRSKATATTAAYMSLIGKTVQKGLKDLGISENSSNGGGMNTLESDDEEEKQGSGDDERDDPTKIKCGALAFADAFLGMEENEYVKEEDEVVVGEEDEEKSNCRVLLGLRHCAFDTRAAEAWAAIREEGKKSMGMDLVLDTRMNSVLEEHTIGALRGDSEYETELVEMAERYEEAMDALSKIREKSIQAAKAAAARMKAEADMEASWGGGVEMGDYSEPYVGSDDESWDSDADYDVEEDEVDFF